jgi:hypothetical protein
MSVAEPRQADSRAWLVGLLALPALLLGFLQLTTPVTSAFSRFGFDGRFYAAMTGDARFDADYIHTAPWCWRVLTPALASLLPFRTLTQFQVLGFFCNWLTLALLYATLRRSGLAHRASLFGVLLYGGVFWALKFSVYTPAYIDFQTQTFIVTVYFCLVSRIDWALPMLLTLGVLQKESLLLFLPTVLVVLLRSRRGSRLSLALLLGALVTLPVAANIILHRSIVPSNDYEPIKGAIANVLLLLAHGSWWLVLLHALFSGLGILPALLLCFPRRTASVFKQRPEWLVSVLIGGAALFGGSDKGRLFLYMLPAVVLVAAHVVSDKLRAARAITWGWVGLTLLAHLFIGNLLSPMPPTDVYLARMVPEHARSVSPHPYLAVFLAVAVSWAIVTRVLEKHLPAAVTPEA